MPTPEEIDTLIIPEGVPVLVRETSDDTDVIYPADRTQLTYRLHAAPASRFRPPSDA